MSLMKHPFEVPTKISTRDHIYSWLKTSIVQLDLLPGDRISENEISSTLNISRTPVREALIRLSQEELVVVYPQKGTMIAKIDLSLAEEARFIREHLEKAVLREAAESFPPDSLSELLSNVKSQEVVLKEKNVKKLYDLDEQFHKIIFDGCRKSRIWKIITSMNAHLNRLRMLQYSTNLDWDRVVDEHSQIAQSIEQRNPEKAERLLEAHLRTVIVDQQKLKQLYPDYFKDQ